MWLLAITNFTLLGGIYGISFWMPQIVKDLGVQDVFMNGLVNSIPFAVACVAMGANAERRAVILLEILHKPVTVQIDAAQLINSAVVAAKGDVTNKDAMRDEMRKANFPSVRGPFKYGNNHFPIQNFYLQDVVKDADGQLSLKTVATIVKDDQDRFAEKCPMK